MLIEQRKNLFVFDFKEPDGNLQEFLSGEVRYASLEKAFPEESKKLRAELEKEFNERYEALRLLAYPSSVSVLGHKHQITDTEHTKEGNAVEVGHEGHVDTKSSKA